MSTRFGFAVPGLLAGLVLAACGNAPPREAGPSTLTLLYEGDEWALSLQHDDMPKMLVFMPLVANRGACADPGPAIARRWEHSADLREWTMHLDPSLRWHDGTPVTAHDVRATADLWNHPDVQWYAGATFRSVEVVDDSTVRVRHDRSSSGVLGAWDVFYPKHVLDTLDPAGYHQWDFWTRPIGNGPFRYVRHVPKSFIELEANPDYYRGRPKVDRLILRFGSNALTELLAGNVDVAHVTPLDAIKLQGDPRFRVYASPFGSRHQIFWNHRNPLFSSASVRRALTQAIDRRELHRVLNLPEGLPITDAVFSSCQFAARELPEPWPHDPAAAAALLDAEGWRDTDGDGVRDREGRPFRFELTASDGIYGEAALYVQDQLRRVGVDAQIRTVADWHAYVRDGGFEAVIGSQPSGGGHNLGVFYGPRSRIGYSNPEIDRLFASLTPTLGREGVDSIYRALQPLVHQDVPVTFLAPQVAYTVAHRRVRGLDSGGHVDPFTRAAELWIEEER